MSQSALNEGVPSEGLPSRPRLRIDSRRRWVPDIREVLGYRQLVVLLGRRDITVRYRQTLLGSIWLFAGALVTAGLFSLVFGRIAQLPSGGVPYFVFSFAGLFAWNLFSNSLSSASGSVNSNSALISKIYFPRLVFPLAALPSVLVNTLLSFVILLVLLVVYGISITAQILVLPFWLFLAVLLALGVGLFLASFSVAYRDVAFATPILVSLFLYVSPVAYSIEAVPEDLRNLYLLNPVATIVEGTRWSVLGGSELPPTWSIVYTIALTSVLFCIGVAVFTRRESGFADVI